jgi:glycine C-acetyltransferase
MSHSPPKRFYQEVHDTLQAIKADGFYKSEQIISSPQGARIQTHNNRHFLNFCANNYLGLSNHPELIQAAKTGLESHGFGLASARFICGTQNIHRELELRLAEFLGTDDAILYTSCFDANGGLFEPLLGPNDAVISDSLNHASIIDGIRLCKANRFRYDNNDMADLERQLRAANSAHATTKLIATDGVFSMDGVIANLNGICDLADQYDALVMVDDSHAVGFMGDSGRGTHEHCGVMGRVDLITGTLGKALGGASGGYTAGNREIIDLLRQRSRPYLFSNSLTPAIVTAALRALEMVSEDSEPRSKLLDNSAYFRESMSGAGFDLAGDNHPIIPVMIGDASLAQHLAEKLLEKNIYVTAFSFPVVPTGQARIRTQMSAAHTRQQIDVCIHAFTETGKTLNII